MPAFHDLDHRGALGGRRVLLCQREVELERPGLVKHRVTYRELVARPKFVPIDGELFVRSGGG